MEVVPGPRSVVHGGCLSDRLIDWLIWRWEFVFSLLQSALPVGVNCSCSRVSNDKNCTRLVKLRVKDKIIYTSRSFEDAGKFVDCSSNCSIDWLIDLTPCISSFSVHSEDDIRPAKRRRKSDCPSRPKKRNPTKFSLTTSLDHRAAAQLQCSEFIQQTTYTNGHFVPQHQQTQPNFSSHNHDSNYFTAAANQYHDARRQQGNSPHFNAGGSYQNGMLPSPAREFPSSLPYCSTAQPVYNNVSMCDDPDRQALPGFGKKMRALLKYLTMSVITSIN